MKILRTQLLVPLLGLCLLAGAPAKKGAKDAPKPGEIVQLVRALEACKSLETCETVRALVAKGAAVWPEIEVGLRAESEWVRFWTLGVLSEIPGQPKGGALAGHKGLIAALARSLDDGAVRVRAAAAYALGANRSRAVTSHLLKALSDRDLNVRFAAVVGLGRIRDPASVEPLIVALRDRDEEVRAHAARALGRIGDRRATKGLVERLREDLKPQVRGFTAIALGELRDPSSLRPLLERVAKEQDVKALAAAVYALGELRDQAARPALEALRKHSDETVREYAGDALAKLAPPKVAPKP